MTKPKTMSLKSILKNDLDPLHQNPPQKVTQVQKTTVLIAVVADL
jgi:hypothetical protein